MMSWHIQIKKPDKDRKIEFFYWHNDTPEVGIYDGKFVVTADNKIPWSSIFMWKYLDDERSE